MSPAELAAFICRAVQKLAEQGDVDSIKTLEVIFNLLEDDGQL